MNDVQTEGQFVWTSGESVTFTNWYAGEPNNFGSGEDYVQTNAYYWDGPGFWNDCANECDPTTMAVIEKGIDGGNQPDLIVTAVTSPATGVAGGNIDVSFGIKNQGGQAAGSFWVGFYLSTDSTITTADFPSWGCSYDSLAAGESSGCGGLIEIPSGLPAGLYYLGAYADSDNIVAESNETNNGLAAANRITITSGVTTYALTLLKVGTGTGTVSGGGNYAAGATVNLTAVAATGSTFAGWSPSPCATSFAMPASNLNCTATFTAIPPNTYTVTVTKAGTGSGTVSGGGSYAAGATVNLTATPASGSTFAGWSPSPCATSFTMPAINLNCTATFNQSSQTFGAAVGVFRGGQWYLDANGNGAWDGCGTEFCFSGFGQAGDRPASGNWDGGAKSYIGVLRSGTGEWFIDRNGNRQWDGCAVDGCYSGFGAPGDLPVAGDWNGTGFAKIGVFRNGQWYLDANGNGKWDGCGTELCLSFGQAGDLPVAGNWDGGLKAGVGVFRAGTWYLDYNGNGAWDGCGIDRCYFNSFGQAGDLPAAGDWNGDGKAKVGVFRAGTWYLDYNGNGAWDGCGVDRCYVGSFGTAGDLPVAGKW